MQASPDSAWINPAVQPFLAAAKRKWMSLSVLIMSCATVLALLVVSLAAGFLYHEKNNVLNDSGRQLQHLSVGVANHAFVEMEALDRLMKDVSGRVAKYEFSNPDHVRQAIQSPYMRKILEDLTISLPNTQALILLDTQGEVIGHSHSYLPYGRRFAENQVLSAIPLKDLQTVIGNSLLEDGKMAFYMMRKLYDARQNFVGTVAGSIDMQYFEQLLGMSELSANRAISMWYENGVLLARKPALIDPAQSEMQQPLVEGLRAYTSPFTFTSHQSQTAYLVGPAEIGKYNLYVSVSSPVEEILGEWRRKEWWVIVLVSLLCAGIAGMAFLTLRRLQDQKSLTLANEHLKVRAERQRAAEEIAKQHARFAAALDKMSHGLIMFNGEGKMIFANIAFYQHFGLESKHVPPGTYVKDAIRAAIVYGNLQQESYEQLAGSGEKHEPTHHLGRQQYLRHFKDGRCFSVNYTPHDGGWITTYEDITEQRNTDAKIAHLAHHDGLTGLPNRLQLREQTDALLPLVDQSAFAMLYLDLDHFKDVNDTMGHPAGDKLLCQVAQRLRDITRDTDMIARLGGDEFAILVHPIESQGHLEALSKRIVHALSSPFTIEDQQVFIGTSVGIAMAPLHGTDASTLFRNADLALYKSKSEGRGRYAFFEDAMEQRVRAKKDLENELRQALVLSQFELYYQPIIHVPTKEISGFEALLRWRHPERGMMSPAEFIPIAEENGFILKMGEWALEHACHTATTWPDGLKIAVNLSPVQFKSKHLVASVKKALQRSGLAPNRLELEITETAMMHDPDATLLILKEIKALGVRIAMDDFGTGYSSLAYLQYFPFDKVKIDKAFIQDTKCTNRAIVKAVTGIAESLCIYTTAEGVETQEQLLRIQELGCQEAQGYYFSRPVPHAEVLTLLQHHQTTSKKAS